MPWAAEEFLTLSKDLLGEAINELILLEMWYKPDTCVIRFQKGWHAWLLLVVNKVVIILCFGFPFFVCRNRIGGWAIGFHDSKSVIGQAYVDLLSFTLDAEVFCRVACISCIRMMLKMWLLANKRIRTYIYWVETWFWHL